LQATNSLQWDALKRRQVKEFTRARLADAKLLAAALISRARSKQRLGAADPAALRAGPAALEAD
jgi:hypothetical protein